MTQTITWVSENLNELRQTHAGQWVAISGKRMIASANTLADLMEILRPLNIEDPFITQIPRGRIIWNTIFPSPYTILVGEEDSEVEMEFEPQDEVGAITP